MTSPIGNFFAGRERDLEKKKKEKGKKEGERGEKEKKREGKRKRKEREEKSKITHIKRKYYKGIRLHSLLAFPCPSPPSAFSVFLP